MWKSHLIAFVSIGGITNALYQPRPRDDNDGIHLAVKPRCGALSGATADVNAGLHSSSFKTLVSFGDSYTDGGHDDGRPLDPPILIPPSSLAGGRSTNGLTWVELVANDIGANLKDYAQSAACIDLSLWPSNPRQVDFVHQVQTFLNQSNNLDPATTLYSIFFGINDYLASLIDGDHMQAAAQVLLNQIELLASPPTNARSFMVLDVYGRGATAPSGEAFKQTVFSGLSNFHTRTDGIRLDVSYVDFSTIWNGVLGPDPGFKAFGYVSTDSCTQCTAENGCSTIGACSDPEHYFYWIPGHPSKETNRIMADFVAKVWNDCKNPLPIGATLSSGTSESSFRPIHLASDFIVYSLFLPYLSFLVLF